MGTNGFTNSLRHNLNNRPTSKTTAQCGQVLSMQVPFSFCSCSLQLHTCVLQESSNHKLTYYRQVPKAATWVITQPPYQCLSHIPAHLTADEDRIRQVHSFICKLHYRCFNVQLSPLSHMPTHSKPAQLPDKRDTWPLYLSSLDHSDHLKI